MAKKTFYITTAIYYPNDIPHVGHAYTTIVADALARWNKLQGKDVFFLTGTDDHGKKIANIAKQNKKKPKEFVDALVPKFKSAWKKLNIDYSKFIRTTDKDHEKNVQEMLQRAYDKGDIYKGEYEGLYCVGCEAYYTEKDLENGCCPIHKKPVEKIKEESYFFKLSKYQKKLLELYKKNVNFILPKSRQKEIINRVKEGLNDLSISRTNFDWGVQLPFDKKHICYVWFDALFNYHSGVKGKKYWPADVHLIGKDIIWFHTVYWPAFLMSVGEKLPKKVFAHGWWTFDKEKISKSRGKVINVDELISIAGVDSARYFLLRATPFGDDGDFSEKALIDRHNNELANKLGNLVSRVGGLIEKNGVEKTENRIHISEHLRKGICERKVEIKEVLSDNPKDNFYVFEKRSKNEVWSYGFSEALRYTLEAITLLVETYMKNYELDKALNTIFSFIDHCNQYVQDRKIWETKNKRDLYELKESILKIAELLWPFIPESSEKITKQFSAKNVKKGEILFKKI